MYNIPSWQLQDISTLSSNNDLWGVDPSIIASIDQAESNGRGGGINSAGYGGFFGLGANNEYPAGTLTTSELTSTSSTSFEDQAVIAASDFARLLTDNTDNVYSAEQEYQGGSTEGDSVFASNNVPSYDAPTTVNTMEAITNSGSATTSNNTAQLTSAVTSAQSSQPTDTLGKVLVALDGYMNPSTTPLESILTLGLSGIESTIVMLVSRLIGVGVGVGMLATGVYLGFVKPAGGVSGILGMANQRQRLGQASQRLELTQNAQDIAAQRVAQQAQARAQQAATAQHRADTARREHERRVAQAADNTKGSRSKGAKKLRDMVD
jgi:hypothetical protein